MHRCLASARLSRLFGLALLVVLLAISASSRADTSPRLTVDWPALFKNGTDYLTRKSEAEPTSERASALAQPPPTLGTAWFGVAPRVSLVARDWGGAKRLAGGQLSLTDAMRLSRSSRMIMSRIRLGDESMRIVPFAQVGLGQWRVDSELMPQMLKDTELAAQGGAGIEP